MNYYKYLNLNRVMILEQLERLFETYKFEFLSDTYGDLIVMKDKLDSAVNGISDLGVLIKYVSWWCYVNPRSAAHTGCPHGMGGPSAKYVDGWFSELQNKGYEVDEHTIDRLIFRYDRQTVQRVNQETLAGIHEMLRHPFTYTLTESIKDNACVTPSLWLLVPKDWRRRNQA
jgi:hypothetical protein